MAFASFNAGSAAQSQTELSAPQHVVEGYKASAARGSKANKEKVYTWAEKDQYGIGMALVAMSIVFSALVVLYICFRTIGKANQLGKNKEQSNEDEPSNATAVADTGNADNGEVMAAIGLALSQALNAHDEESDVLTITPKQTAWNSPINLLRTVPNT